MIDLITAPFATCREADLVVERLVQTHGPPRTAIGIAPKREDNTVGVRRSGGDLDAYATSVEGRADAPLGSRVKISVTAQAADDDAVRNVFREFGGET